jgi:branched-chain amino acid aminotransferase
VLELCARDGIPCEEVDLPMHALTTADEAFLTSSTREVQAIATVDGHVLPAAPGPVTQRLREAFRARVAEEVAAFSR